nr:hypothetical protein [Tanacetum cinerariifolium]
ARKPDSRTLEQYEYGTAGRPDGYGNARGYRGCCARRLHGSIRALRHWRFGQPALRFRVRPVVAPATTQRAESPR